MGHALGITFLFVCPKLPQNVKFFIWMCSNCMLLLSFVKVTCGCPLNEGSGSFSRNIAYPLWFCMVWYGPRHSWNYLLSIFVNRWPLNLYKHRKHGNVDFRDNCWSLKSLGITENPPKPSVRLTRLPGRGVLPPHKIYPLGTLFCGIMQKSWTWKDAPRKMIENCLTNSWKSWIWDLCTEKNMKRKLNIF